jgi:hypothetical protein
MEFRRKNETVLAKILSETVEIEGEVLAVPGDWVVTNERGQRLICKADVFVSEYEPTCGSNPTSFLSD